MYIFKFINENNNYASGEYYFIAAKFEQAQVMAEKFAADHNKKHNNYPAYTIEWKKKVFRFEIKPGYMPINREYNE